MLLTFLPQKLQVSPRTHLPTKKGNNVVSFKKTVILPTVAMSDYRCGDFFTTEAAAMSGYRCGDFLPQNLQVSPWILLPTKKASLTKKGKNNMSSQKVHVLYYNDNFV